MRAADAVSTLKNDADWHQVCLCHLAASGANTQLRVVRLDLLVMNVVSRNLLLHVCQGGAKLL